MSWDETALIFMYQLRDHWSQPKDKYLAQHLHIRVNQGAVKRTAKAFRPPKGLLQGVTVTSQTQKSSPSEASDSIYQGWRLTFAGADTTYVVALTGTSFFNSARSQSQAPVLTPATNSVSLGQSITFNCNVGVKDGGVTKFIKQTPGEAPLGIMSHHHSWTNPRYAPGVSSAHFTATINSAGTEYQFIIRNTELMDAATYYCVKWYVSLSGYHCERDHDKNTTISAETGTEKR
ncbi:hypothetical protein NDU88_000705 [Pleurodeles waltl]|uniref:Ig-like domain-containing protein n=1 Tax=Pleurodeles waltl TaxID=8319 RepID=A0AAV7KMR0_PLEWA|nr:hypothetical protein NDU88_000705 [Pleurodeles waltl]